MANRDRDLSGLSILILGLLGLALLLGAVGVVLLVTQNVALADNVASVSSFVLAAITAGVSLTMWYRMRSEERLRVARHEGPQDHWLRSARGSDSTTGFFFTGRRDPMAQLAEVARRHEPALAVVLGMPGAGKSATLSVLVLRNTAPDSIPAGLADSVPQFTVDAAVHARLKSVADVVAELNAAMGFTVVDEAHAQEALFSSLEGSDRTRVVIVDAVDEASDPLEFGAFVTQLSWHAVVLAGTRPDEAEKRGSSSEPPRPMRSRVALAIDLSAQENVDRDEVATYVRARLRADPRRHGYSNSWHWTNELLLEVIGREVAAGANDNFLVTQMITDELLSREPIRGISPGWSDTLKWPSEFASWMDRDLKRRLGLDRLWLAQALIPLAYAEGDGLPIDLWRRSLSFMDTDSRLGPAQIEEALVTLGFYIATTNLSPGKEAALVVGYQLRHQQFAEYFRQSPLAGKREGAIAKVILDSIPRKADGRRKWQEIGIYARRNLLVHARQAGMLAQLLDEDPLCLAAVDTSSALDAVSTLHTSVTPDLPRIVRRAAYGSGTTFEERTARLEFHARLADNPRLAWAFSSATEDASQDQPWRTPWRAGGSSAAVPDGDVFMSKAALPIEWSTPAAVIIDVDYRAEVMDLLSRSPLGPKVVLRDFVLSDPDMWDACNVGGSAYLTIAWEDGALRTWCLAGPSASPRMLASGQAEERLRSIRMLAGPGGVPLVAALAGTAPGTLVIWSISDGRLKPHDAPTHVGGDKVIALDGTDFAGSIVVGSLHDGLHVLRLTRRSDVPFVTSVTNGPVSLLAAKGNESDGIALITLEDQILAVAIHRDRAEILPPALGPGGPLVKAALTYENGSAKAVIVANGHLSIWTLLPQPSLLIDSQIESMTRSVTVLDSDARFVALSKGSGEVNILAANANGTLEERITLPAGESLVETLAVPTVSPQSVTLVTRAPSNVTKVWLVDTTPLPAPTHQSTLGKVTALSAASYSSGAVIAAADETPMVAIWNLQEDDLDQSAELVLRHCEAVEMVSVAVDNGYPTVVAVGDDHATLWQFSSEMTSQPQAHSWAVSPGVAEHVVVVESKLISVVAMGGGEGLEIWCLPSQGHAHRVASADIPITGVIVVRKSVDEIIVAATDEDGVIHLVTVVPGGETTHLRTSSDMAEIIRCIPLINRDSQPHLVTISFTGRISVWDISGEDLHVIKEFVLPMAPTLGLGVPSANGSLLVFTTPASVFVWDIFNSPSPGTRLDTGGRRPSHLLLVGEGTELRVVCAYTSGALEVIYPHSAESFDIQLNCEFSQMVGVSRPPWALASHGRALIAIQAEGTGRSI
jgi:hypothetical protein